MPDCVDQQTQAAFEDKGGADPAHTAEAVAIGFERIGFLITKEGWGVADRNYVSAYDIRVGGNSGCSNCRGPKMINALTGHDWDSPLKVCAGGMRTPLQDSLHQRNEMILSLFLQEICDLYHFAINMGMVNFLGKYGTKFVNFWRRASESDQELSVFEPDLADLTVELAEL